MEKQAVSLDTVDCWYKIEPLDCASPTPKQTQKQYWKEVLRYGISNCFSRLTDARMPPNSNRTRDNDSNGAIMRRGTTLLLFWCILLYNAALFFGYESMERLRSGWTCGVLFYRYYIVHECLILLYLLCFDWLNLINKRARIFRVERIDAPLKCTHKSTRRSKCEGWHRFSLIPSSILLTQAHKIKPPSIHSPHSTITQQQYDLGSILYCHEARRHDQNQRCSSFQRVAQCANPRTNYCRHKNHAQIQQRQGEYVILKNEIE